MLPLNLSWPPPFPYFCYNHLPTSRSHLLPALLWEPRRRAAQAWQDRATWSSVVALHHQIWDLLPPCHHVPPLNDAQRQFLLSRVRTLGSLLAGRVRDCKARFLIQAPSAFPSPPSLGIVQFKREHHNSSNALHQGPHKAIEWGTRKCKSDPHSREHPVPAKLRNSPCARKQNHYPTSTGSLSTAVLLWPQSSAGQDNTALPC